MTQQQDNGLLPQIQEVLLNDQDFVKDILTRSLQQFLEAEFSSQINACPYERSESRQGYRNGSYPRTLKTRVGQLELRVCRDREGNFQTSLFERYQRSEKALTLSLVEMYLQGVSTRRVNRIVEELCGCSISKSHVSDLAKGLDKSLGLWRERRLEQAYPYLVIDARYEHIRTDEGVVCKAVMLVVGISEAGYREILSVDIGNSEQELEWGAVFSRLKARGLSGVRYVVSDDHKGLAAALRRHFQGVMWQRCQVHFMRNFLSKLSKKERPEYIVMLKDVFAAQTKAEAMKRKVVLVDRLAEKKEEVANWLDDEIESSLSVYSLPLGHRRKMRSTNMLERVNQELKRRSRVVRIFPNDRSCLRLIGSLCQEISEEWAIARKYLEMEVDDE